MVCSFCRRRSVGACARCGRHYCNAHGRELCRDCASPISALPADLTYRAVVLTSGLLAALALVYLQMWPTLPSGRPRTLLFSSQFSEPADGATNNESVSTGALVLATSTATPSPTPAPATLSPSPTPVSAVQYTVVSGDTLIDIAARHGVSAESIIRANDLSNAALLHIDQVLQIPR